MTTSVVWLAGAGGHARACIDVIECHGGFSVAGLIGLPDEVGTTVLGYPVVGTDRDLPGLIAQHRAVIVAAGHIKTSAIRRRLFDTVVAHGGDLPVVVSPRAHVSRHAVVGAGTIVMHGAVVNAGAVVGRNGIINSQALVEHDVVVGDHCHVATAATVNSGVRIGDGTFIGSGARVRQCLTIGSNCVVGMGQIVVVDCPDGTWLPGQP